MDDSTRFTLIIGGSGFIGTHLAARLSNPTIIVDRNEPTFTLKSHQVFIKWDLGFDQPESQLSNLISKALNGGKISCLIQLAHYYDFSNKPNPRYQATNMAIGRLFTAISSLLSSDALAIHTTSMAACKPSLAGELLKPEGERLGAWQYPRAKIEAENIFKATNVFPKKLELILSGVYSDWCELVPLYQTIKLVMSKSFEKFFYPGNIDCGLTYIHIDDLVDVILIAMNKRDRLTSFKRLFVGQDQVCSYRDIVTKTSEIAYGKVQPIIQVPRFLAWFGAIFLSFFASLVGQRRFIKGWMIPFAGEHYPLETSETKDTLDWKPERTMGKDLDLIVGHAVSDPAAFKKRNDLRPW